MFLFIIIIYNIFLLNVIPKGVGKCFYFNFSNKNEQQNYVAKTIFRIQFILVASVQTKLLTQVSLEIKAYT